MKGLSTQQYLSLSMEKFLSMSENELRKAVSTMASTANKRIKNLEKNNLRSPAYIQVKNNGGKFTTKKKNLAQLRNEYMRAKSFLILETSSVTGYKKVRKKVIANLQKNKNIKLKEKDYDKVFEIYEAIKEINSEAGMQRIKYGLISEINKQVIEDGDIDMNIIAQKVEDMINKIYERSIEEDAELNNLFNLLYSIGE